MSNVNIFEVAIRSKMRFPFKGVLSTEDLWDLTVEDLDTIFKALNGQIKQVKEESLLSNRTKEDKILDTKIEIVKYIVSIKLAEAELKLKEKENKAKKQKILSILSVKQDEEIQNKSVDELTAMLNDLD